MVAPVVLAALLFWACVFAVYFAALGTTPAEVFLGKYEPLPDDIGTWKECGIDEHLGLLREERLLVPAAGSGAGSLLHQVRYRDPQTRVIVQAGPERKVRRRRIRAAVSK